jgi:hypothetical protein
VAGIFRAISLTDSSEIAETSQPEQKRHILLRILEWVVYGIPILTFGSVLAVCGLFFWISVGYPAVQNWKIEATFQVYPGAQKVAGAYGYYGAGAGKRAVYYWTADSIDDVRDYYETFTLPFIERQNFEVTVFEPSGKPLPVVTHEYKFDEIIDLGTNRHCYYKLPYKCVQVALMNAEGVSNLPFFDIMRMRKTPKPLSPEMSQGGTVIIYYYYTNDIS